MNTMDKMDRKIDVICIGNSALDLPLKPLDESVFTIDSYPVDRIFPTIGGSATNVSVILSRLGRSVALVTLLGKDLMGEYILANCRENGIDTASVVVDSGVDTPLSVGLVRADGERSFVVSRASSTFRFDASHVDLSRIKEARLLDIASIFINPKLDGEGLCAIFAEARKHGLCICADMMKSRGGKKLKDIREALAYLDYFFPNYEEAADLTQESGLDAIADRILDCGVKNVVIKRGKSGCFVKNSRLRLEVPAFRNEAPVDTIGAGDNFVAGFLAAILEGSEIGECARFANAVAAVSVGAPGSTNGVRDRLQIDEFMSARTREGGGKP